MTHPRSSSAVDVIKLYFFSGHNTARSAGCPYTTLALLTGEDPWTLRAIYNSKPTMTSQVMVKHLKKHGFTVKRITSEKTLNLLKKGKGFNDSHVILATVRMTAHEASWVVFYGGVMWHNFDPTPTSYVTSLTFPLINAFTLFLPEWDHCEIESVQKKQILEEAKLYRKIIDQYSALQNSELKTNSTNNEISSNNSGVGSSNTVDDDRKESSKN